MHLTIDFETRSDIDLLKCGAWVYSEGFRTDVLCLVIKEDDKEPVLWLSGLTRSILATAGFVELERSGRMNIEGVQLLSNAMVNTLMDRADTIEAHNAEFEQAIWKNIMAKRFGFEEAPISKWCCSAAKVASFSLPRSLAGAGEVLKIDIQKDKEGYALMMKMCKPRKPIKADPEELKDGRVLWHETPEQITRLIRYCIVDVESEHALSKDLKGLSPSEQELWFLDQKINQKGIAVDAEAIEAILEMVGTEKEALNLRAKEITGFNASQSLKVTGWLSEELGIKVKNVQKETVLKLLEREDLPAKVKEFLVIRQQAGLSSVTKFTSMLRTKCKDGRIKGSLLFHGAGTGRWAGKMFQPHNLPKKSYENVEDAIRLIKNKDYGFLGAVYDDPMIAASHLVRSVLVAEEGNILYCSDFSAIEARVLDWFADNTKNLKAYVNGICTYKLAACGVYNVPYDEVTGDQRQVGKVIILACGYQGGWRAFMAMAKVYGLEAPSWVTLEEEDYYEYEKDFKEKKNKMPVKEAKMMKWAKPIVLSWRADNSLVVEFWDACGEAARQAIKNPGKVISEVVTKHGNYVFDNLKFAVNGRWLQIRLPSGRLISYYKPEMGLSEAPWGKNIESINYWGVDSISKRWVQKSTYGGKIVENIVQGTARDLMSDAMKRADAKDYPIIFHVHDEIVAEVSEGRNSLDEFDAIMSTVPIWAAGCPIDAKGFESKRYKKG